MIWFFEYTYDRIESQINACRRISGLLRRWSNDNRFALNSYSDLQIRKYHAANSPATNSDTASSGTRTRHCPLMVSLGSSTIRKLSRRPTG